MSTLTRRPRMNAMLGAALVAVLTGCSVGSDVTKTSTSSSASTPSPSTSALPTASEAWARTQDSIRAYKQVTATGSVDVNSVKSDLTYSGDVDGEPTTMHMAAPGEGSFDVRLIGTSAYIKADRTFWTKNSNSAAASLFMNRWVKAPAKQLTASAGGNLALKEQFDAMANPSDPDSKRMASSTLSRDTVAGKDAYKLVSPGGDITVWTTADGNYDLLRISDDTHDHTDLTFSDWNHTPAVTAPADAVDLGSLGGGTRATSTT